jgi:hypothetical protein
VKRRSILRSTHTFLMLNISAIMSVGDRVTMAIPRPIIVIPEGGPAHLGYLGCIFSTALLHALLYATARHRLVSFSPAA